MSSYKKPTEYFDTELADMLSKKIRAAYPAFNHVSFTGKIEQGIQGKTLKQRVELMTDALHQYLPENYPASVDILLQILGPENPEETGMFTEFYWLMPVAKFVEKYGLDHFDISIHAIGEITKRNTGEYAIRPFIQKYPQKTLRVMEQWAKSENFHLRRLASEGLRPKLPWATKLELFIENPSPVFGILELLKKDPVHFVKKSVANHITDYLKVNPKAANELILNWQQLENEHTMWILKHATRKHK